MKTTAIRKSMDGMSAASNSCFPTSAKTTQKIKWLDNKELYKANITSHERVVTPVHFATDIHKKPYLMDCVTGTLYRPDDGSCASSDTLKIIKFTKSDNLKPMLMKIKVQEVIE